MSPHFQTYIRNKGVVFDSQDHPDGLSTCIIAETCSNKCKNCINEHLRNYKTQNTHIEELVGYAIANTLGSCLTLGGLEWTEQIEDLYAILDYCKHENLSVILYTHWDEQELKEKFPKLLEYDIWIKYGEYREDLKTNGLYTSCGIPLASYNQYIKRSKT